MGNEKNNTDPVRALIAKWRQQAAEHGTRTFTGNDHALFANELESALASAPPSAAVVAWHIQHEDGLVVLRKLESVDSHMREQAAADGVRIRPLTFADAAPSAPVGVDLSKLQRYAWSSRGWEPDPKGPMIQFKDIEALAQQPAAPNREPATHYHCAEGIQGTAKRLRRYAKLNKTNLMGQTMEEAAAYIEAMQPTKGRG